MIDKRKFNHTLRYVVTAGITLFFVALVSAASPDSIPGAIAVRTLSGLFLKVLLLQSSI